MTWRGAEVWLASAQDGDRMVSPSQATHNAVRRPLGDLFVFPPSHRLKCMYYGVIRLDLVTFGGLRLTGRSPRVHSPIIDKRSLTPNPFFFVLTHRPFSGEGYSALHSCTVPADTVHTYTYTKPTNGRFGITLRTPDSRTGGLCQQPSPCTGY